MEAVDVPDGRLQDLDLKLSQTNIDQNGNKCDQITFLGDRLPPADLRDRGLEPPELELPGEALVLLHDPLPQEADVAAPGYVVVVRLLLLWPSYPPRSKGCYRFWHRRLQ